MRPLAHARALSVAAVYGGAGIDRQTKLARRAHVLVATPGRLEDLIERGAFSLDQIKILVLDEADRMLDMGFRPAVDRIVSADSRATVRPSSSRPPSTGSSGKLARSYTRDARSHEHAAPRERRGDVDHRFVRHAGGEDRRARARAERPRARPTLVFVRTKRGADRLVKRLSAHDIPAVAMHGNKSQAQREKALMSFEAGRVDTLVATDVAARGLDIDDITHVINFDAPEDRDGYVHRIGRTGRAGRTGTGITFFAADQAHSVRQIAKGLSLDGDFESSGHHGRAPAPDRHAPNQQSRSRSRSRRRRRRRAPA